MTKTIVAKNSLLSSLLVNLKDLWRKEKRTIERVPLAVHAIPPHYEPKITDYADYSRIVNKSSAQVHLSNQIR